MNVVQPHNVRPVSTTVGELEPGTIFRTPDNVKWCIKTDEGGDVAICCLPDGLLRHGCALDPVNEIADSVTITKEIKEREEPNE